jgi:hypothetical protein
MQQPDIEELGDECLNCSAYLPYTAKVCYYCGRPTKGLFKFPHKERPLTNANDQHKEKARMKNKNKYSEAT